MMTGLPTNHFSRNGIKTKTIFRPRKQKHGEFPGANPTTFEFTATTPAL
jgi:hypothetical protein